jgi:hypothetical protein
MSGRRKIIQSVGMGLAFVLVGYGVAEVLVSTAVVWRVVDMGVYSMYCERTGGIRFVPELGFRLEREPMRFVSYIGEHLEQEGRYQGNNYGFPDAHDVQPQRARPGTFRVAVLGDSLTAAPYLQVSWPDRVNEMLRASGQDVEVLNCAQDGGGLVNWWIVVDRILAREGFELDGIIVTAFWDSMHRGLCVMHSDADQVYFGETDTWSPMLWPRNVEEALEVMWPIGRVVSTEEFERARREGIYPEWRPYLFQMAYGAIQLRRYFREVTSDRNRMRQEPFVNGLMDCMGERGWRVMTVFTGSKGYIHNHYYVPPSQKDFADRMESVSFHGNHAFEGLTPGEITAMWYKYDGHWNQEGSDQFAVYMYGQILNWRDAIEREKAR